MTPGQPGVGVAPKALVPTKPEVRVLSTPAIVCVGVLAALYLAYVAAYSVNVPQGDDWSVPPIIHGALHGHFTWGSLWHQHNEDRLVLSNLVFVVSGFVDHYNIRALLAVSAIVYIGSYWLLLLLLRRYMGRTLGVVPVLAVGVVWLSVGDWDNSLWAFQLAWYLTVFLFVVMCYLLLIPARWPKTTFVLALVAALGASVSTVQGFFLWPIGLLILAWRAPRILSRKVIVESAVWLVAAAAMSAVYFTGYDFRNSACINTANNCSISFVAHHPGWLIQFFLALVGNVVPTSGWTTYLNERAVHFGGHEIVGAALCLSGIFVIVQSVRQRRYGIRPPLPVVLVVFGLLFDVVISVGRLGSGLDAGLTNDRFIMPNIVLLTGIVIYACAHAPSLKEVRGTFAMRCGGARGDTRKILATAGVSVVALFVLFQVVESTTFGITNGRVNREISLIQSRLLVNLDKVPTDDRGCVLNAAVLFNLASPSSAVELLKEPIRDARADHLSVYESGTAAAFLGQEPPVFAACGTGGRLGPPYPPKN